MSFSPDESAGEIVVHVFGRTDVGRTREHNEDAFVVVDLSTDNATLQPEVRTHVAGPKGTLFMVADGMGGAAAGEIASAMAVEVVLGDLRASWIHDKGAGGEGFIRAIKRATKLANEKIHAYATTHLEYRGMGTTATIAGLLGDTLYLAQVGDSRAYIVRDGRVRQITKDQSLMQKLIEAGELTEEEAEHSERRNIILQALGPEPTIKVDLTHQTIRRGDTLVLCSDGLSSQVSKDDIAAVVVAEKDLMAACKTLIDIANEKGGPDNITVILARFDGAGLQSAASEDEVGHRVFQLPETGQTPSMPFDRVISADAPTTPVPIPERFRPSNPSSVPRVSGPTSSSSASSSGRPSSPSASSSSSASSSASRSSAATSATMPMDIPVRVSSAGPSSPARPSGPPGPPLADVEKTVPTGELRVHVSPARRSTGRIIATVLLAVLVVGAIWYVVKTVRATAATSTTAPRP